MQSRQRILFGGNGSARLLPTHYVLSRPPVALKQRVDRGGDDFSPSTVVSTGCCGGHDLRLILLASVYTVDSIGAIPNHNSECSASDQDIRRVDVVARGPQWACQERCINLGSYLKNSMSKEPLGAV